MSQQIQSHYNIRDVRTPLINDIDTDIEWICKCFGFLESRDKNESAKKIFTIIIDTLNNGEGISSDELAEKVGVTRAGVVHHLNKMMSAGLVIRREGKYQLRMKSVENTIIEIQRDIMRIFENMKKVARDIDHALEIPHRRGHL